MRHLLCVVAAWLLILPPVQAEPGPTASYLMNTPPSLLTLGLARLDQHLDKIIEEHNEWRLAWLHSTVVYDAPKDKIAIVLWCTDGLDRCEATEQSCKFAIEAVRGLALLREGKVANPMRQYGSRFALFFQQASNSVKPDEKLANGIDQMFIVRVSMSNSGKKADCWAPLLGKDIFLGKD